MKPTPFALAPEDTAARILAEAQRLVQTRGFNGFSYADIAAALGVTKASLHYHFASKAELGHRLIERYSADFLAALAGIDARCACACDKLEAYVDIYAGVLAQDRMCLCGMLAAEYATLPAAMQAAIGAFFAANEAWLARVLRDGRKGGELVFTGDPDENASVLTGALEGAMLVARAHGGADLFKASADLLLANYCGGVGKRLAPISRQTRRKAQR